MHPYRLGFLGFGHMAKILFESIDRAKILPRSQVSFRQRDAHKMHDNEQRFGLTATSLPRLLEQSDLIFLCVRPQQLENALREVREAGGLRGKWLVSILAGVPLAYFHQHLGKDAQVLRAMPNLCSAVGEGMTALSYGPLCSSDFRELANCLFGAGGEILEVPEQLMDVVVGMSGSGPAFVLRLLNAMAHFGEKHGMSAPDALKMAAQTFAGAAKLVLKGAKPADLLVQIAVPQGKTQAGLDVMNQLQLDHHFQQALEATMSRSAQLSKSLHPSKTDQL